MLHQNYYTQCLDQTHYFPIQLIENMLLKIRRDEVGINIVRIIYTFFNLNIKFIVIKFGERYRFCQTIYAKEMFVLIKIVLEELVIIGIKFVAFNVYPFLTKITDNSLVIKCNRPMAYSTRVGYHNRVGVKGNRYRGGEPMKK